jgi:acyl-CoA reductase-like NAD-dependent aldehyde dehydrogenase
MTITMSPQPWELDTLEDAECHLQRLDFQPFHLQNLVNGELVSHPLNDWVDSVNPKTGLRFACVPNSTPEQIDEAVKAADAAFPSWSTTPPSQRSEYLMRIASRIEEQRELFAVWESIDQGKTLTRARVEIDRAVSNFR